MCVLTHEEKFMRKILVIAAVATCASAFAQLEISIGIRETGTTEPIGGNGGTSGGIEWINLDGQTLNLDGTWQTFTFNFGTDSVTAFAGATADGALTGTKGTLEHIRIRNAGGIDQAITVWVDDVTNTEATGNSVNFGDFENFVAGDEVMFQEPGFSGSTSGNIVTGSSAGVDDTMAATGNNSYRADFTFVDGDPTRWVRWTTFGANNLLNPAIDFSQGNSLSFSMKGEAVPEPATMTLLGLGALAAFRRKKRA